MNQGAIESFRSPRARRIGSSALAAFIIAYLAIITYSLSDRLNSARNVAILALLWGLGVLALVLLLRSWRRSVTDSK
jgi:hypothetical protein